MKTFLLIDPYVHRHFSRRDIKICNNVCDVLIERHEHIDHRKIVASVLASFTSGMQPTALMIHVKRHLKLDVGHSPVPAE